MFELGVNYFGVADYVLLGLTLLVSLLIGLYYGYKGKQTNEELLVGGRNMSIFPVATSVMVTYVSAITVLGFPSEIVFYGSQIFCLHIVSAVFIPISAFLIMPFFYEMKLTSINEYLEKRFDSKWIRWLASAIFIAQQVVLSGVVLYAPSIALEIFLGIPMPISVLAISICGTIYTNFGGIKAVVITDLFQCFMMIIGMAVICWKGISASGGFLNVFHVANQRGRLNFFDFTFDPFSRHNFWNFLLGTGFHAVMQPGIHQLQVQRYSGMSSCTKAKQALIGSVPLKLLIMSLCLLTGLSLFALYANCDPLTAGRIKKIDQIVPYFVVHELAEVPGMMGIFTSCIFSAVLSSLSSSLNSLAAVTWEDFLVRIKYFKAMTTRAQTNVSRLIGAVFGVICMGLAFSVQNLGAIYSATFAVIGATAGALYGVFIMAMFLPFVNAVGGIVGMLSGLVVTVMISIVAFLNKTKPKTLPLSIDECPAEESIQIFDYGNVTTISPQILNAPLISSISFDEWPWKIFTLSYLLYPIVAAIVSIIIGILVSALASICIPYYRKQKPLASHIHPLARQICGCFIAREPYEINQYWTSNTHLSGSYHHGSRSCMVGNGIPMNPIAIDTSAAYIQPKRESQGRINAGYATSLNF